MTDRTASGDASFNISSSFNIYNKVKLPKAGSNAIVSVPVGTETKNPGFKIRTRSDVEFRTKD
jgi:hypothetical protein